MLCFYQLKKDFNQFKREMYTIHHLDVSLGKTDKEVRYSVNKEVVTFKPEELRLKTSDIMCDHLYGESATELERKEQMWKQ